MLRHGADKRLPLGGGEAVEDGWDGGHGVAMQPVEEELSETK